MPPDNNEQKWNRQPFLFRCEKRTFCWWTFTTDHEKCVFRFSFLLEIMKQLVDLDFVVIIMWVWDSAHREWDAGFTRIIHSTLEPIIILMQYKLMCVIILIIIIVIKKGAHARKAFTSGKMNEWRRRQLITSYGARVNWLFFFFSFFFLFTRPQRARARARKNEREFVSFSIQFTTSPTLHFIVFLH